MKILFLSLSLYGLTGLALANAADAPWVHDTYKDGDFKLAQGTQMAEVFVAPEDFKCDQIAANLFTEDVERVTGHKPSLVSDAAKLKGPAVILGTLGQSPVIDKLVADGKFDAKQLQGQWESFLIGTVANPLPGVDSALVICGSDRRGTAYGVFEVSQGIGVSPWYWWADVTPAHRDNLFVAAGTKRFGPPSVKYRGIFINDEDWGMNVWASKTFEPEANNLGPKFAPLVKGPPSAAEASAEAKISSIGPKTYAKIFELLLRLKANTLWPAMHEVTTPFNLVPGNAQMADDYGIVMGSSHAEPMLRNNVNEWPHDDQAAYDFATNPDGVTKYWEERVQSNGKYESIYTIGMRGIHDSAIQLPRGANPVSVLEQIFSVQRGLLAKYVNPDPAKVPQIFCPYKEVLAEFLGNLTVPPDVTVVFPDDNFGYIRYFPTPEQIAARPGGFGVYYHISYLGAPYSYVWLNTTPPALIWEEMSKAYDHDMKNLWILNVGDLKPGEIGIDFFMQMAWDEKKWNPGNLQNYLTSFAEQQFGAEHAEEIGNWLGDFYHLSYQRKPEHLLWNIKGEAARPSDISYTDYNEGYKRYAGFNLEEMAINALYQQLPASQKDAFYELVAYPMVGTALANERFLANELAAHDLSQGRAAALDWAAAFNDFTAKLDTVSNHYNDLAGGKWKYMMPDDPLQRDRSYRNPLLSQTVSANQFKPAEAPGMGVAIQGRTEALQAGEIAALPYIDPYTDRQPKVSVFNTGTSTGDWTIKVSEPWINVKIINSWSDLALVKVSDLMMVNVQG
ncbi:MAG TPA: glycosyl hydrolase 115 family protein, partial [Opitutales bacterium]|nr:glycosyl hydrolase 115 family protein [Opitutales bacterium]